MSDPIYAAAAPAYQRNGWSPVPLPPGKKFPPPIGWTGYAAPMASGADVHEWASNGHASSNLALRTPPTVIGLDVDNYDDKTGLETMLGKVAELGALPKTYTSTSRDDGISGIRFYRVPPGRRWADVLGPGVEIIHYGHRYAVAAPSIHPEGRTYGWLDQSGQRCAAPTVDDLPPLPDAWVSALDAGDIADRPGKADIDDTEVREWLDALPDGSPCSYLVRLLDGAQDALSDPQTRHDKVRTVIGRVVRGGDQGHVGVTTALDTLQSMWLAALKSGKVRQPDPGEWSRMVVGAVAMCVKKPVHEADKGCCGDAPELVDWVPDQDVVREHDGHDDDRVEAQLDAAAQFAREVAYETHRLRVREAAKEAVATEKAAQVEMPPFDADLLGDVLARPAEPPMRVDGLIPSDAATLIVAMRKTGKTTGQLNLARCLLTGEPFLDKFDVRKLAGRIGFLNYEVSAAQLATWADEVGVPRERLYLVNLRGRRNPLAHPEDREKLAEQLVAHEVESLFVDPFGRAYTGQSQNDSGEVGAWLADLDRFVRSDVGAADLILAVHAGWEGERTRGASALEDWGDSIVTLTRDKDDETVRYFKATGRDVDVDEDRLSFDPETRHLSLTGQGSRKQARSARQVDDLVPEIVTYVGDFPNCSQAAIEANVSGRREAIRQAISQADRDGLIKREKTGNKWVHRALAPLAPDSPGATSTTSPPRLYRGEGEIRREGSGETGTGRGEQSRCLDCDQPIDWPAPEACGASQLHRGDAA